MTSDQSGLLTRVDKASPMGQLLADYWQPLCRSERVRTGSRLKLERIHRTVTLIRDQSDRMQGFDAEGDPVAVREAGDIIWGCLSSPAPPLPLFESLAVPPDHRDVRCAVTKANWLQTMEAVLDTVHLGFLHRSSILAAASAGTFQNLSSLFDDTAPRIEVERTNYGLREAARRFLPDGRVNTRIREYIGPNHVLIPSEPDSERQHIITLPIDDVSTIQFIITYNPFRPITRAEIDTIWFDTLPDRDDIMNGAAGEASTWDQDRQAMRDGHFSGLTHRQSLYEDLAICESMGRIVDHSGEHLTACDITIASVRRELLRALQHREHGKPGWREYLTKAPLQHMRSHVAMLAPDSDWRGISPFFDLPVLG